MLATRAFLDLETITIPTSANGTTTITITDTSAKSATGFLKVPGTTETYGAELGGAWTNNVGNPYETFTPGAGADITQAINNAGGFGIAYRAAVAATNKLYRAIYNVTIASGSGPRITWSADIGMNAPTTAFTTLAPQGLTTTYRTAIANHADLGVWLNAQASNFSLANYSMKEVLTPSPQGSTVVSTSGGATQTWASIDAGFILNDTSYQVRIVRFR